MSTNIASFYLASSNLHHGPELIANLESVKIPESCEIFRCATGSEEFIRRELASLLLSRIDPPQEPSNAEDRDFVCGHPQDPQELEMVSGL